MLMIFICRWPTLRLFEYLKTSSAKMIKWETREQWNHYILLKWQQTGCFKVHQLQKIEMSNCLHAIFRYLCQHVWNKCVNCLYRRCFCVNLFGSNRMTVCFRSPVLYYTQLTRTHAHTHTHTRTEREREREIHIYIYIYIYIYICNVTTYVKTSIQMNNIKAN